MPNSSYFPVAGQCDPRFEAVRRAFEANFANGDDVGASVAITLDGALVVDLWGGAADAAKTIAWQRDTITCVFSTTKTMMALCALMLADRGELDFDAPVARYWAQFAAGGKSDVKVCHLLGHTAGLAGVTEPITVDDLYDWDKVTAFLAAQSPWWEPGTRSGYHAMTQGFLLGEVVRRITGQTLGTFFRREFAEPLGADFHIGLPPAFDDRVSMAVAPKASPAPPASPTPTALRMTANPVVPPTEIFTERWRRAEVPAGNGVGNARAVAQLHALLACGGTLGGRRFITPRGCEAVFQLQCDNVDLVFSERVRWGLGLALSLGTLSFGPRACFWGGSGGSLVVLDLAKRMSFAYVMNRIEGAPFGDPRNAPLISATYDALAAAGI